MDQLILGSLDVPLSRKKLYLLSNKPREKGLSLFCNTQVFQPYSVQRVKFLHLRKHILARHLNCLLQSTHCHQLTKIVWSILHLIQLMSQYVLESSMDSFPSLKPLGCTHQGKQDCLSELSQQNYSVTIIAISII